MNANILPFVSNMKVALSVEAERSPVYIVLSTLQVIG